MDKERGFIMLGLENIKDTNSLELIKRQWQEFLRLFTKQEKVDLVEQRLEQERRDFIEIVNKAKNEWIESQNYFENVSNPDLIDLAIYRMEASKIFYMYLIKEAKKKGISALEK
jgi:hypothetical protein